MDHALFVSVFQSFRNLPRDGQSFLERDGTLRDALGQRRPFHQLHHERSLFYSVDRGDAGMVERRQHAGFSRETHHAVGVTSECFGDDFDRDFAAQLGVESAIDFAHASFADFGDHPVVRDRLHHRFSAASQLTTTVMGAAAELSGAVETLLTRNRFPSAVTS